MSVEKRSYGVRVEPKFRLARMKDVITPSIDVRMSKKFFQLGVTEETILEISSNAPVDDLVIDFLGAEAEPVRLKNVPGGRSISVPVKLRFIKAGKQELVLRTSYSYSGGTRFKETKVDVEVGDIEKSLERVFIAENNRKYRLVRRIGEGGFAEVYEALDEDGNAVALKIYKSLSGKCIEEIGRLKILVERLGNPPYVVRVIGTGIGSLEGDRRPYIVMEYYPMNLETLLSRRGVGLKDGVKVMVKVAKVLAYAHKIGVTHGDLKPQNILIKEEGGRFYPAIGDWGGGITPCYSAPEIYERGSGAFSEKSDVWSFGVVLYEVITNSKLFKGKSDYEKSIKEGVAVSVPHIPRLEDLINRCLHRDPAKRPSFLEVVSELGAYLKEELGTYITGDRLDAELAEKIVELGRVVEDRKEFFERSREIIGWRVAESTLSRLFNYAYFIKNVSRAHKALESGNVKEMQHWLEVIDKVPEDEELFKIMKNTGCLEVFSSTLDLVTIVKHDRVSLRDLLKETIERLSLCLDITMIEVLELIVNTIRSAAERQRSF